MDDLILLFSSKKYELDLKSIFYFFNSYNKEDQWSKELAQKYGNLSEMKLEELKENLKNLDGSGIYKAENENEIENENKNKNNYSNLFTSLYEKKEAIDFLRKKAKKKNKSKKMNHAPEVTPHGSGNYMIE